MRQNEFDVDEDEMSVMSDDFDTKSRCNLMGERECHQKVNWQQNQVSLREYREKMARKYRFVIGINHSSVKKLPAFLKQMKLRL